MENMVVSGNQNRGIRVVNRDMLKYMALFLYFGRICIYKIPLKICDQTSDNLTDHTDFLLSM